MGLYFLCLVYEHPWSGRGPLFIQNYTSMVLSSEGFSTGRTERPHLALPKKRQKVAPSSYWKSLPRAPNFEDPPLLAGKFWRHYTCIGKPLK